MNLRDAAFSEYRAQTCLALLQSVTVMAGTLLVVGFMKVWDVPASGPLDLSWPSFFRHWGLVLLAVPVLWAWVTIGLERNVCGAFTRRWTIVSGLLVLAGLAWFYLIGAARCLSSLIVS